MTKEEFKAIRKQSGLSQWGLALKLGVSQATVSEWTNGYRPIPDDVAEVMRTLCV